jgi:secreted trypsin-like serine protease
MSHRTATWLAWSLCVLSLALTRLSSCVGCTTAVEPRYVGTSLDCFYDSNTINLVSLNDFSRDVRLEVQNLPAGVTSQTATMLTLPRRGVVSTPFKLQASGDAALGNASVTVRATSGSIVHTLNLPISVADQLPSC